MWLDLVGISPWYIIQVLGALDVEADIEHYVNQLRLVRTVRLALILRNNEQTKIIYQSIKASLRPLSITLFFLFTLVMILATAIFYAEPCYNVETCTFTDIFNSAYFVMVTVATVGYGNQVPSLKNPGSTMLTMIAMILGQIYFSMPVAIIGNNFQLMYESFQLGKKKKKARYLDASLSPFDCQKLHPHAKRLCDIQYHLLNTWFVVHNHIHIIMSSATESMTMTMEMRETEADRLVKIKEGISRLMEVHAEAVVLLQVFLPHRRRSFRSDLDSNAHGVLGSMYAKAKRAMTKAKVRSGHHSVIVDPNTASQTLRGRIWLLLEVPDSSRLAAIVNQAMVAFALVSIMLFFTESLQELAASGVETEGCKSVVKSYCRTTGLKKLDPACFLRFENGTSDFTTQLHFSCSSVNELPGCYGNGLNFGSLDPSALSCQDAFLQAGADFVCYRQQCRTSLKMIFDMGPYWIYFEWYFGIVFTLELALRFYISQNRKHFWRNIYVIFDVVAIVPFFVEVIELLFARIRPDYAIVATSPSFLSVIRVLKILRILKLTRVRFLFGKTIFFCLHFLLTLALVAFSRDKSAGIHGGKSLETPRYPGKSAAYDITKWLKFSFSLPQLYFLFTGCIIAGALFYEIERGKECFVGEVCMWWNKDVLTPELAAGLPIGKRILIQDKLKSTIIDMIHSTWLSYTTYRVDLVRRSRSDSVELAPPSFGLADTSDEASMSRKRSLGQLWKPLGDQNAHYVLEKRSRANGVRLHRFHHIIPIEEFSDNKLKAKDLKGVTTRIMQRIEAARSRPSDNQSEDEMGSPAVAPYQMCAPMNDRDPFASVTEFHSDPSVDMFQIGRMPCRQNDFVIPGPRVGASGTISRYAARILCSREPPFECRIFAGGFDAARRMSTAGHALKHCARCGAWSKRLGTDHTCVMKTLMEQARDEERGFFARNVKGNNSVKHYIDETSEDGPLEHFEVDIQDANELPLDGLTKNGVRVWLPEHKQWFEVSVNGRLYAIESRTADTTASAPLSSSSDRRRHHDSALRSRSGAFNRPATGAEDLPPILTDGAVIDLGGVQLQFQTSYRSELETKAESSELLEAP
ncbi:Voltage-dependent channel, four helix bundle domain [Phytophthora cactorum]|nr:Voltage-dependent channel, four helix bundle domain [Phytophthora cactorum]